MSLLMFDDPLITPLSVQQAQLLSNSVDPYRVAAFVEDSSWGDSLVPRVPHQPSRLELRASNQHSTLYLQFEEANVLIDPSETFRLPEGPTPLILVTHAHHDHTSGLVQAAARYPQASIIMTPQTLALLQISTRQSDAITRLIESRGYLIPPNGQPHTLEGLTLRLWPAGHLLGAAMLDIETTEGRILVTGDFALRETGGLQGATWPDASYDIVFMEASHAWDLSYPTPFVSQNRQALVDACEAALMGGSRSLIILANALGEATEVYYALVQSQMNGLLPKMTLRLAGYALEVAHLYASAITKNYSPWRLPIHKLGSPDYVPENSIVIASGSESADGIGHRLREKAKQDNIALIQPAPYFAKQTPDRYRLSLHASFPELLATACGLRCHQIALYHSNTSLRDAPLAKKLQQKGRSLAFLTKPINIIGG